LAALTKCTKQTVVKKALDIFIHFFKPFFRHFI